MFPLPNTLSPCHWRPFTNVSFAKYIMSYFQQKGMPKRWKPQFKKDEWASDPGSAIPSPEHGSNHDTSEKNCLRTLFWHLTPFYFASHFAIYSFYRWLSVRFSGCVHACACLHISIIQRTQRPISTLSPIPSIKRLQYKQRLINVAEPLTVVTVF